MNSNVRLQGIIFCSFKANILKLPKLIFQLEMSPFRENGSKTAPLSNEESFSPTEGRLTNLVAFLNKQLEWCFVCGRKEREFLCEKVQSGRCFRQI